MVRTLELRATQDGVIWPSRPLISARGLLSTIKNLPLTTYDKTQLTRFRDVTFNSSGDLLAATDEKGRIFVFFIASNRYALVQHLGVPTIACCFSPLRKTELLVTCENETVRLCVGCVCERAIDYRAVHSASRACCDYGLCALSTRRHDVSTCSRKCSSARSVGIGTPRAQRRSRRLGSSHSLRRKTL